LRREIKAGDALRICDREQYLAHKKAQRAQKISEKVDKLGD
jgi:hypothetical protein